MAVGAPTEAPMRLHLWIPTYTVGEPDFGQLPARARAAEHLGFDGLFLLDHLLPIAGVHTSAWYDTLTALAVLAASTERITIGTASLVAGFRHPVVLAKQLASIAVLAGPRVILGAGSGWYAAEYAAFGYRIDERGARTDETLAAVRQLLESPSRVSFAGRHWAFEDVSIEPRPGWRVPIWVAGGGRTADAGSDRDLPQLADSVRRRILAYEGWIAPCAGREALTLSDLGQVRASLEPGQDLQLAHVQWTHIVDTDDPDEALREQLPHFRALMGDHHTDEHLRETYLLGSRPEIEARVRRLREAGFEDLIVGPVVHDPAQAELIAAMLGPVARSSD